MWGKIVFGLRIAAASWVGLVALVAALQAVGLVPQLPKVEPFAWVFSLIIIGIDNAGTIVSRKYHASKKRRDSEIEKVVMSLLIGCVDGKPSLRFEHLGASVYVRAWRQPRTGPTRLKRIKRFRPAGLPQQSGIRWTSLTGAVGECWRTKRVVTKDWQKVAERYADTAIDDAAFQRISADTRAGFTREEFVAIVGSYSEVVAVPIWHPGKESTMLGVLTVDRAFRGQDATFRPTLATTRRRAEAAAAVLAHTIKPTPGE